ncbi:MAG: glycosyltransferase [Kofleriaceae bacterium]|nr:glycosyltransferase [Candidatus Methylomirabilis lanthanidiphila]
MSVTVIVAAHNEGDAIADRLNNIAALDVPIRATVEVIVASDGSTDSTNEIVAAWSDPKVRLLTLPRGGRAMAHNRAAEIARGDILVFTDARTSFRADFLSAILGHFSDPRVGCAVGRLVYATDRHTVAEDTGRYWTYETRLREWESAAGLLTAGSGCCMAVRKQLFRTLQPDEDVDDAVPLDLLLGLHRIVFVRDAVVFDVAPSTLRDEILARARMTVLCLTALLRRGALLNPFRFPKAAVALLSHRILRYLTPVLACGAFLSSTILAMEPLYRSAFVIQVLFYLFAFVGLVIGKAGSAIAVFRVPMSFCAWNAGFAAGLLKVVRRQRITVYEPI